MNKKPQQSYTETVTHNGEKLEITINIHKEPILKTSEKSFYTHIEISRLGNHWGRLFLENPVEEKDFEQAIKDVHTNIESYKSYEPDAKQFSQN